MSFKTSAQADAFNLRRKHREFDEGDYEAVWNEAHRELRLQDRVIRASKRQITERCFDILVKGRD